MTDKHPRVYKAFLRVHKLVSTIFPQVAETRILRCYEADRAHEQKWRWFMHTMHFPYTVCFAAAAEEQLSEGELLGMILHEFGHLAAEPDQAMRNPPFEKTPDSAQMKADLVVAKDLGFSSFIYNDWELQEVSLTEFELKEREIYGSGSGSASA